MPDKKPPYNTSDTIIRPYGDPYEYKKVGDKYYTRKTEGEWDQEYAKGDGPKWNLATGKAQKAIKNKVYKEKPIAKNTTKDSSEEAMARMIDYYKQSAPWMSDADIRAMVTDLTEQSKNQQKSNLTEQQQNDVIYNKRPVFGGPSSGNTVVAGGSDFYNRDKDASQKIFNIDDGLTAEEAATEFVDFAGDTAAEFTYKPIVRTAKKIYNEPGEFADDVMTTGSQLMNLPINLGVEAMRSYSSGDFDANNVVDMEALKTTTDALSLFPAFKLAGQGTKVVPKILNKADNVVWPKKVYRAKTASGKKNIDYGGGQKISAKEQKLLDKVEKQGEWYTDDIEELGQYLKGNESRAGIFQGDDMIIDQVKIPFWAKNKNITTNKNVINLKKEQGYIVDNSPGGLYTPRINPNEYIIPRKSIFYPKKSTTIKAMPDHIPNQPVYYTIKDGTQVNISDLFKRSHTIMDPPKGSPTYLTKPYQYLDEQIEGATGINPSFYEGLRAGGYMSKIKNNRLGDPPSFKKFLGEEPANYTTTNFQDNEGYDLKLVFPTGKRRPTRFGYDDYYEGKTEITKDDPRYKAIRKELKPIIKEEFKEQKLDKRFQREDYYTGNKTYKPSQEFLDRVQYQADQIASGNTDKMGDTDALVDIVRKDLNLDSFAYSSNSGTKKERKIAKGLEHSPEWYAAKALQEKDALGVSMPIKKYGGAMAPIIPTYYKSKGTPIYRDTTALPFKKGGSINIKPENKGKFTAKARAANMAVQTFANKVLEATKEKYSPITRKQANFAHNAKTWNRTGGTIYPKYFDNGGPGDSEKTDNKKPTNPIRKGNFLSALYDMGKYNLDRKTSEIELPEQGDMSDYEYFSSLDRSQIAAIDAKRRMYERDQIAEQYHVDDVKKNIINIGKVIQDPNSNYKQDYEYLGVPWMGEGPVFDEEGYMDPAKTNWFFKSSPAKPGYADYKTKDGKFYNNPYVCQGVNCAIGRKAGARIAYDGKFGKAGQLWPVVTGNKSMDPKERTTSMGIYQKDPKEGIEAADIIKLDYNLPEGTSHTMFVGEDKDGNVIGDNRGNEVIYPMYGSAYYSGVKDQGHWPFHTDTLGINSLNEEEYTPEGLSMGLQTNTGTKGDALLRYEGRLPELNKRLESTKDLYDRYRNYKLENSLSEMPIIKAELTRPESAVSLPVEYSTEFMSPSKGKRRKKQEKDVAEFYKDYFNMMNNKNK